MINKIIDTGSNIVFNEIIEHYIISTFYVEGDSLFSQHEETLLKEDSGIIIFKVYIDLINSSLNPENKSHEKVT